MKQCGISADVARFGEQVLVPLRGRFAAIDDTAEINQLKVITAFQECR